MSGHCAAACIFPTSVRGTAGRKAGLFAFGIKPFLWEPVKHCVFMGTIFIGILTQPCGEVSVAGKLGKERVVLENM